MTSAGKFPESPKGGMRMEAYYAMQWPRENLFCTGYIHEVMNFRYTWHETE